MAVEEANQQVGIERQRCGITLSALGLHLSPLIPHPVFSPHGQCALGLSGQQGPSEAAAGPTYGYMTGDQPPRGGGQHLLRSPAPQAHPGKHTHT